MFSSCSIQTIFDNTLSFAAGLVCNLNHAVAYHAAAVLVTLLQFHGDLILAVLLILHMHHCVVQVRVELLAYCLDRFHSGIFQSFHELLVDLFNAFGEGRPLLILRHGCQASLEVV